jgi:hypothetical protein
VSRLLLMKKRIKMIILQTRKRNVKKSSIFVFTTDVRGQLNNRRPRQNRRTLKPVFVKRLINFFSYNAPVDSTKINYE